MRILAIDTATESCSAALWIDGVVSAREKRLERGHAAHILLMVDELLREAATTLGALGAVGFGRGPGAFTGVRLAASVAQGFAFGAGLPVVPVSDLRALAQRALAAQPEAVRVLACTDARMHEVYWACFARDADGLARPVGEEHVSPPGAVRIPEVWQPESPVPTPASAQPLVAAQRYAAVCGAGAGFAAYPELRGLLGATAATVLEDLLPRAHEVAHLAAAEVLAGRVLPPDQALPVYLRDDVTRPRPGTS